MLLTSNDVWFVR